MKISLYNKRNKVWSDFDIDKISYIKISILIDFKGNISHAIHTDLSYSTNLSFYSTSSDEFDYTEFGSPNLFNHYLRNLEEKLKDFIKYESEIYTDDINEYPSKGILYYDINKIKSILHNTSDDGYSLLLSDGRAVPFTFRTDVPYRSEGFINQLNRRIALKNL